MREFLERAECFGIQIEDMDRQAKLCDLLRDVIIDRECFEAMLLNTNLHDRLIAEIRVQIDRETNASLRPDSFVKIAG